MKGRVVWYQPAAGRGVIETDDGRELAVVDLPPAADLGGGDLIELRDKHQGGACGAPAVRLVSRWTDQLSSKHRSLVNEFHALMRGESP